MENLVRMRECHHRAELPGTPQALQVRGPAQRDERRARHYVHRQNFQTVSYVVLRYAHVVQPKGWITAVLLPEVRGNPLDLFELCLAIILPAVRDKKVDALSRPHGAAQLRRASVTGQAAKHRAVPPEDVNGEVIPLYAPERITGHLQQALPMRAGFGHGEIVRDTPGCHGKGIVLDTNDDALLPMVPVVAGWEAHVLLVLGAVDPPSPAAHHDGGVQHRGEEGAITLLPAFVVVGPARNAAADSAGASNAGGSDWQEHGSAGSHVGEPVRQAGGRGGEASSERAAAHQVQAEDAAEHAQGMLEPASRCLVCAAEPLLRAAAAPNPGHEAALHRQNFGAGQRGPVDEGHVSGILEAPDGVLQAVAQHEGGQE
mmetsp:Transcript_73883/g.203901  ORF Transcript_73883/g.203901 Transcript_73883/m.203901 type:complete len:372 (-) Transcript_73883:552-1667(-)